MDTLFEQLEVEDGEDRDEDEQDHANGCRIADLVELEGVLVEREHERVRRVLRPSLRHDLDGLEDLERGDDLDDNNEEERRRYHGQRDLSEGRPLLRMVELRCLIEILRHGLQGRCEDQGIVADGLPDRDRDQRPQGIAWVSEPIDGRDSKGSEDLVQQAIILVHDPEPQKRYRSKRDHIRREDDCLEKAVPARRLLEVQRDEHAKRYGKAHREDHVDERVREGLVELRVLDQASEVLESDEGPLGIHEVPVEEGKPSHLEDRHDPEDDEHDCGRADEDIGPEHPEDAPGALMLPVLCWVAGKGRACFHQAATLPSCASKKWSDPRSTESVTLVPTSTSGWLKVLNDTIPNGASA